MNLLKNSAKNLVGGAITRMNEVAGDDDERNAAVIAIDNVDDAGKASGLGRAHTVERRRAPDVCR